MEFHADEIAANVTGFEPLKSSLLRLSFSDYSFNSVISFYERKITENEKSENIYREHLYATNFLAQDNNIEIENNLPQISVSELNKFNKSKLVVKDQWASHPSTEDRIAMLEKTGLSSKNIDHKSANSLFTDIEKSQRELTNKMFNEIVYQGKCSTLPFESFQSEFNIEFVENTFPKVYKGYYDNKNPLLFDIEHIEPNTEDAVLEKLFNEDNLEIVYSALSLQSDIESIKLISDKNSDIKTFDYDGVKYKKKDCVELTQKLEIELKKQNVQIEQNDINIFQFFRNLEKKTENDSILERLYEQFFDYDKEFESKYNIYIELSNELQFISQTTPFEQIKSNFKKIEPWEEKLKNEIRELLDNPDYQTELTKEVRDNFELYLTKKWQYFGNEKYFDSNLEIIFTAMNNYAFLLSRGYFLIKKKLLNYQYELLNTSK
jgi:hypothetical protein